MNKIREVERYFLDEYQTIPQMLIEYSCSPLTLFTLLTVKEFTVLGVTLGEKHQEHSQGEMKWSYNGIFLQRCISEVVPWAASVRLPECRGVIVLPHALVHTPGNTRDFPINPTSTRVGIMPGFGSPSNLKFIM